MHDCNQRYDTGRGYYVMRDGAVEDATNRQPCPDCGFFPISRGATMADTVWLCANEEVVRLTSAYGFEPYLDAIVQHVDELFSR